MRKYIVISILVSSLFFMMGCKSNNSNRGRNTSTTTSSSKIKVKFEKSKTLTAVLDKAAKLNKPVFVDFYTSWCTPCKMMDKDVFTDAALGNYYNKNFVSYKVDCETQNGANLASIFNVGAYPTLLWLDTKGNVLVRYQGGAYHSKMYQLGDDALKLFKGRTAAL